MNFTSTEIIVTDYELHQLIVTIFFNCYFISLFKCCKNKNRDRS